MLLSCELVLIPLDIELLDFIDVACIVTLGMMFESVGVGTKVTNRNARRHSIRIEAIARRILA